MSVLPFVYSSICDPLVIIFLRQNFWSDLRGAIFNDSYPSQKKTVKHNTQVYIHSNVTMA